MKKIVTFALSVMMVVSLAACGTSSGGGGASDAEFSSLNWDGSAVEFTAKQELTLTGISVFSGSQEFKANYVANSEGNMGFSNGTTLTPGSSIGFHGGLIIFANTTASCAIDTGGADVDKVCFYLKDGGTLERSL